MECDTGNHVLSKVFGAGGLKCESSTYTRKGRTIKSYQVWLHIIVPSKPIAKRQKGTVLLYMFALENYSA